MATVSLRLGAALLILVLLTPALVLSLQVSWEARRDQIEAQKKSALDIARSIAVTSTQAVRTTHSVLSAFSRVPSIANGRWHECAEFLAQLMTDPAYAAYTGFGVFDLDGDLVCNSRPTSAINVADRPWFKETLRIKEFANGGYQVGRASGRAVLPFGHPVYGEDGKPTAVLLGALKLDWLEDSIKRSHGGAGSVIRVLDAAGLILAHAPDDGEWIGLRMKLPPGAADEALEGFLEAADVDAVPRFFAYSRMTETGATVLVEVRGLSAAENDRIFVIAAALLAAVVAMGSFAGWLGLSFFLKPIDELVSATRKIGQGRDVRISNETFVREFRELTEAFGNMATRVVERERSLTESRAEISLLLESVGEGIVGLSRDGLVSFSNRECSQIIGFSSAELLGADMHALLHHTRADGVPHPREECPIYRCIQSGQLSKVTDDVFWHKDGHGVRIEYSVTPVFRDDQIDGAVLVFRDVTERRRLEELQRYAETRFHLLFNSAGDAIFVHAPGGHFLEVNDVACHRLGYSREELLAMSPDDLDAPELAGQIAERTRRIAETGSMTFETEHVCRDGRRIATEISAHVMRFGEDITIVSIARDITERKALENNIRQLAHYDPLTQLPNRTLSMDRLGVAISRAKRNHGEACVFYMDLDRFKAVNDSLGHEAGDELLQQVATRLVECVRDSDTVGRIGGDEFLVILPDVGTHDAAATVAGKIVDSLSVPFTLTRGEASIGISIGIAFFSTSGAEAGQILSAADSALYRAKQGGRNRWHFAAPDSDPGSR